jgi:hypothetical protein
VVDQGAESQFPAGVRFFLTARGPDIINDIRVFFTKMGNTTSSAYRNVAFEPGQTVSGESILRTGTGNSYIPPGTMMEYSFEIRDKAGRVHRTEGRPFIYLDNRFEWRTVSDGLITVYYYGEFAERRAQVILEASREALERMRPVLGIAPSQPLRIISYNNYRHMSEALPFRAQAVRERLITQGMAFSEERVLLVHAFDASVRGTASHEFTHLLVAEAAGRADAQVPAWLNEGLAEYGNVGSTGDFDKALRQGILARKLRPLWHQATFSGTPDDIIIAYGQASSVVRYLIEHHGAAKVGELMRALQETLNIDRALQQVYGFDQRGLDSQWRTALGLEPLPAPGELEQQGATPTPIPTPVLAPTATPGPTLTAAAEGGKGQQVSPGGCYAAKSGQAGFILELASLAMLMGPMAVLAARISGRRHRFAAHWWCRNR